MIQWRGILSLIGGFLLHLTLGTGFTFGNMSPYITSYFSRFQEISAITVHDAIWIYSMTFVGQGLLMSLGGVLDSYFGPRITTYLGSILASSGVALSYFTITFSMPLLALTYGFLFGMGVGIAYVPPLAACMKWFPERKGLVNGIIVGGFGLGAFIFTQVQTLFLNPNNSLAGEHGYFTDFSMLERVPNVFLLLSAIYATFQFIGCSLLSRPDSYQDNNKEEKKMIISEDSKAEFHYGSVDDREKKSKFEIKPEVQVKSETRSYSPKEMLKHRQFYILWLTFFFNNQIVIYVNSMYKAFGQTFIKDDQFLATVGAVSAIFNAAGRVLWGWFMDKSNYKICMLILTASVSLLTATLGLTTYGGKAMFAAWIWAIFLCFSGSYSLLPTCTTNTFGIKYAGINYGLVFTNTIVTSPLAAILAQSLWSLIGWYGMFGVLAAFSTISFFVTLLFNDIEEEEIYEETV